MRSPHADTDRPTAEARPGCPVLASAWDPLSQDQLRDPWETLARARAETPVFYLPEHDSWFVTGYEDVLEVLGDWQTYSSANVVEVPAFPAAIRAQLADGHPLDGTMLSTDPPIHTRRRKLAQKAFTPRQAALREEGVREIANSLIDGFADGGPLDLAESYCQQIPLRVIGPLMGITSEEAFRVQEWSTDAVLLSVSGDQFTPERLAQCGEGQVEYDRFVRALIADRRRHPLGEEDLITSLIEAEGDDGEPALTEAEIVSTVAGAIAAAGEATATSMLQCVKFLLEQRSWWKEVVADPNLIEAAVEESLRLRGAGRALPRTATRATILGGVELPAGAKIMAHIGAANRDGRIFADPDAFDPHRANLSRHLAFGKWTHFCLGAPLARMVMRASVATLAERLPDLRAVPGHQLQFIPSIVVPPVIRGFVVEWGK